MNIKKKVLKKKQDGKKVTIYESNKFIMTCFGDGLKRSYSVEPKKENQIYEMKELIRFINECY